MKDDDSLYDASSDILPTFSVSDKYIGRRHPQDFLSNWTRLPAVTDSPEVRAAVKLEPSSLELDPKRTVRLNKGEF